MPEIGYQYQRIRMEETAEHVEEKITSILKSFGYVCPKPYPRQKRIQTFIFRRPYDEMDKKIGVPEKRFAKCGRFGTIVVDFHFTDGKDLIPKRISIRPSAGWEFSFANCDRSFMAMETIEETLVPNEHYKTVYKCIDNVTGFETEAEQKLKEENSFAMFFNRRFAGKF